MKTEGTIFFAGRPGSFPIPDHLPAIFTLRLSLTTLQEALPHSPGEAEIDQAWSSTPSCHGVK